MSEHMETLWRTALESRGRDWVKNQLRSRPGQADDIVYDVVFTEPYPTRAFCQSWCDQQDNKVFQFSGYTKAMIVGGILFVVFFLGAAQRWHTQMSMIQKNPAATQRAY